MSPALLVLSFCCWFLVSALRNSLSFSVLKSLSLRGSLWISLISGASPHCSSSLSNAAHECHQVHSGISAVSPSKFHFHISRVCNYNLFPTIGVQQDCLCEDIGNSSGLLYPSTT